MSALLMVKTSEIFKHSGHVLYSYNDKKEKVLFTEGLVKRLGPVSIASKSGNSFFMV